MKICVTFASGFICRHGQICMCVSVCSAFGMHPCCCQQSQTTLLCVSLEIHGVTSWSTCIAVILLEMPVRFDSSGLDTIVCLLHNLSAGKMKSHSPFLPPLCCFQLRAPTWGCLSCRINVSIADFTLDYCGEGIHTAMDLHAFWTGPCAKWGRKNIFLSLVQSH